MNYFLPIHLDGGNRGCEAITKGTAKILGCSKENLICLSRNIHLDTQLHINDHASLHVQRKLSLWNRIKRKIRRIWNNDPTYFQRTYYSFVYDTFLEEISSKDIMLSTGGDMMCYNNNEVIYTNNKVTKNGIKSILWGCSIGKNNLTPEKIETLKRFSLIYARESLTATMLCQELQLKNVVTFPDPAFVLDPQKTDLPECFNKGHVIGLNISNFVLGNLSFSSQIGEDVMSFVQTIIDSTDKHILLIPHVMWKGQDDRIVSNLLYQKYKKSGRLHLLDSNSLNYCQIRYIISKCWMFMGARTHAVISAYSTCVPAIALGYSIKSKGIALDLSLPIETVVDSKNYKAGDLIKAYYFMEKHMDEIRVNLQNIMPKYKNSTYGIKEVIKRYQEDQIESNLSKLENNHVKA